MTYLQQRDELAVALKALGLPTNDWNMHQLHPMEVDANRRADLDLLWRP
ncbi:MAG: hypothetical protein HY690_06125 [Chloroflexi bacterium]|nr:hypothetical protein [Chloroflexota bacterium]